jgi:uncharacterized membrane protein
MVALALAAENWRTSGGVTAAGAGSGAPVDVAWSEVQAIVAVRCVTCHSAAPASPLFADAPAGVTFDSRDDVEARLDGILATAVESRVMPLGNLTGMTDEERVRLGAWIRSRLAE